MNGPCPTEQQGVSFTLTPRSTRSGNNYFFKIFILKYIKIIIFILKFIFNINTSKWSENTQKKIKNKEKNKIQIRKKSTFFKNVFKTQK